eukprot:PhM_4_TR4559/c0_g1_i1/m.51179
MSQRTLFDFGVKKTRVSTTGETIQEITTAPNNNNNNNNKNSKISPLLLDDDNDCYDGRSPNDCKRRKKTVPSTATKKVPTESMCLDVGQSNIGATRCPACGMLFTSGTTDDRIHRSSCVATKKFSMLPRVLTLVKSTHDGNNNKNNIAFYYVPPQLVEGMAVESAVRMVPEALRSVFLSSSEALLSAAVHRVALALDATTNLLRGVLVGQEVANSATPTPVLLRVDVLWTPCTDKEQQLFISESLIDVFASHAIYGYRVKRNEIEI